MLQRTQIYLPEELRREVDVLAKETNVSLAEYARGALQERVKRDKQKKTDLKKLAEEVIGSSNRSEQEVQEWLDWVREERRLSDEVREERLQKVLQRK